MEKVVDKYKNADTFHIMPCRYDETSEEIEAREKASKKKIIQPYKKELDLVTRLLCEVMAELIEAERDHNVSTCEDVFRIIGAMPELQLWWKEHKKRDERRKINETAELRKKAMDKLTIEEKKALGLIKDKK